MTDGPEPTSTRGSFLEHPHDRHVPMRAALLGGRGLPPPELAPEPVPAGCPVDRVEEVLRRQLTAHGLGLVDLGAPLTSADLLELGHRLGDVMPETDPAVLPNVEDGRILHLVSAEGDTADTTRQPFATSALSLHTEGSGRPTGDQPRYIVLMCLHPGDDENAAQTVLVPFAGVDERLRPTEREILAHVRYDRPGVPPVRRQVDGRSIFSFRDFQADTLRWVCETDRFAAVEVRDALAALLAAMYEGGAARGLQWHPGLLAVLDNTYAFHGRSAAPFHGSTRHRHLKRLRITHRSGEMAG
ncbi:TauD/TfdA family dioxygenase [Micromonospora okii]|uniref:TauD/TfdA family dioxygenase n=1 Tax=Micromonospora okii TaxID=1182970 RepID=UPI001E658B6F|nr:TauD/TfdA family dioxygenase [Micromonospora okii]